MEVETVCEWEIRLDSSLVSWMFMVFVTIVVSVRSGKRGRKLVKEFKFEHVHLLV